MATLIGSCNGDRVVRVTFDEHLEAVRCDENGVCRDGGGIEVPGRHVDVRAVASASASRFSPKGTYIYIDYMRGERFVEMEMDFPTEEGTDTAIHAVMREYEQGELAFESTAVDGTIQIVFPGEPYRIPGYGSFHLRFLDAGPDGDAGTTDDRIREIANAVFEIEGYVNSDAPAGVYVPDDAWDDHWISPSLVTIVYYPYDPYVDSYYHDEGYSSGCEGDTYEDDTGSGCSGDTWDDSYDTSSSDSSGCSGDTYDDGAGSGCEGDYALFAPRQPRRLMALFIPAAAVFATRSLLSRRRRDLRSRAMPWS